MKKVLLNATMILAIGTSSFAQSIGKTLPAEQAKTQKYALNPSVVGSQTMAGTRAEGEMFWSDDFSNPANWTFTNTSNPPHGWTITTDLNAPPAATQTAPLRPVNFPTGSNGYAICDSDAAGDGSTTNAILQWNGTPIDCSNFPSVSMKFNAVTRNWSSTYEVLVSPDNGATWQTFAVLQNITTNTNTANSEVVTLNISSAAANNSEVLIAFRYQASWGWFWAVDDVELFETWNYDLNTTQTISSIGEAGFKYTNYPVDQVVSDLRMGFGADVKNNGAMDMNAALKASQGTAWTGTGAQSTLMMGQDSPDTLSILAANGFPIPSTVGTYNISLDVETVETIQNPASVQVTMPFAVTPLVMASDDYNGNAASMNGGFFGWASATGDPGIGLQFEINNPGVIGRVAVGIANVVAASQGDYIGNELYVELWKEVAGELVFAGISEAHIITSGNFGNLVQCYFENPVSVSAGDLVVAIAASGETSLVPVAFSGLHLAGNTIGKAGAGFVTLAADGDYVDVPVVRLDFGNYTGLTDNTLVSNAVNVYPNPTANNVTVSYTLTEESNVAIVVTDLSGKVVFATESGLQGAGTYSPSLDLSQVSQGMYTVTLTANGSQVTKKLIKK